MLTQGGEAEGSTDRISLLRADEDAPEHERNNTKNVYTLLHRFS